MGAAISSRPLAMLRLCQLVSPALPIGAYNFSQGLEYAVDAGWVKDEAGCHAWVSGLAHHSIGTLDLPLLLRLQRAWKCNDLPEVHRWSQRLIAARETAELRAEERHLGRALAKVLVELHIDAAGEWTQREDASYAALFALAAARADIDPVDMAQGYLWAWAENQTLAAVKLLPLGQSAGQRVLNRLLLEMPAIVARALALQDEDIGVSAPLQAMASAWHETQYSRLFRS